MDVAAVTPERPQTVATLAASDDDDEWSDFTSAPATAVGIPEHVQAPGPADRLGVGADEETSLHPEPPSDRPPSPANDPVKAHEKALHLLPHAGIPATESAHGVHMARRGVQRPEAHDDGEGLDLSMFVESKDTMPGMMPSTNAKVPDLPREGGAEIDDEANRAASVTPDTVPVPHPGSAIGTPVFTESESIVPSDNPADCSAITLHVGAVPSGEPESTSTDPAAPPQFGPEYAATMEPVQGFDTLDEVQRYAVGALSVVLLSRYSKSGDLNGLAFAHSLTGNVLAGLGLRPGQQAALLALEPEDENAKQVVEQCVEMIGDEATRFGVVQAMLALAVAGGVYDARSRAFLAVVATVFRVAWRSVGAVELAVAIQLFEQATTAEITESATSPEEGPSDAASGKQAGERIDELAVAPIASRSGVMPHSSRRSASSALASKRKKKMKAQRAMKVSGITVVGGILFGVTGGLIAPALLTALAGVGVTGAAGLLASGGVASGAAVGSLFGVAGAGLSGKKATRRMGSSLSEFDFEHKDDERVIEARRVRAEKAAAKRRKAAQEEEKRMQELAATEELAARSQRLAIEDVKSAEQRGSDGEALEAEFDRIHGVEGAHQDSDIASRNSLAQPAASRNSSGVESDDSLDEAEPSGAKPKKKKGKKAKEKSVNVGVHGLDSAALVPSLHLCVCVPGWLQSRSYGSSLDQFEQALVNEVPCSQHIALRWESRRLYEMSLAFAKFWASKATSTTIQQAYPHAVAAASSVAGAVAFAFAVPLTVLSCMDYIDNPWSVLLSRSNAAGEELADVLIERGYGQRPVTLVGYSLGARVVFKCLESLANRGGFGIVDNAFLVGAPVTADPARWKKARSVVAGRVVNAYLGIDWALAFFHRGCGHGIYVAGLRPIDLAGVENVDMTILGLEGHSELKDAIPRAMDVMGLGRGFIEMPPAALSRKRQQSEENEGTIPVSQTVSPAEAWPQIENGTKNTVPVGDGLLITDGSTPGDTHTGQVVTSGAAAISREPTEIQSSETGSFSDPRSFSPQGQQKSKDKKKKSWFSSLGAWPYKSSSTAGDTPKDEVLEQKAFSMTDMQIAVEQPDNWDPPPMMSTTELSDSAADSDGDNRARASAARRSLSESAESDGMASESEANEADSNDGGFDWELQRRIWEEQERQLRENGVANAPVDVDIPTHVVLGISVETTNRKLRVLLPQDAPLPTETASEVFTNAAEDQRSVVFRIYEHERRTRYVGLNPSSPDAPEYPKLLGSLSLQWDAQKPKGELRFAISASADENGDVTVEAHMTAAGGVPRDTRTIVIARRDLCTMRKRAELEAAEKSRQFTEAAQEPTQLMLPAPAGADGASSMDDVDGANGADAPDARGDPARSTSSSTVGRPRAVAATRELASSSSDPVL